MDEAGRARYETQSKELRTKIKTWEVDFYKNHGGKKPSRLDIKNNREMAAAYKEYQKLRDILDGKVPPPPVSAPARTSNHDHHDKENEGNDNTRKRKSPQQHTPSTKRFRPTTAATLIETPSSRRMHDPHSTMHMFTPRGGGGEATAIATTSTTTTPSLNRKLFPSPAVPTSIGPTPQRDGRVLGLFDMLPFKDAEIDSPCRPSNAPVRLSQVIEAGREAMVEETPRKKSRSQTQTAAGVDVGAGTPSSRHKQHHHQAVGQTPSKRSGSLLLATPLKPHSDDANRIAKTPGTSSGSTSSVSKLQFQTPAFLRRIPTARITESSDYVSPEPIRLPRKPLLRGLSSVVADLRRLQEEELDDELDALREVENEAAGVKAKQVPPKANDPPADKENEATATIPEADTQRRERPVLLGAFDDEAQYDSADEEGAGLDRNGQPLRVYKKKGQKRTTRRSNMKPVRTRRPAAAADEKNTDESQNATSQQHDNRGKRQGGSEGGGGGGGEEEEEEDPALLSGSEFAGSDDEDELAQDMSTLRPRKATKAPARKTGGAAADGKQKPPEKTVKKAARKVNELAHANFKRLKLRNNGAKGGPGYNSRFRRRR